jgi:cell wall-associated NlpC family hydrolase
VLIAITATACATTGGTPRPRPFPGAPLPPSSTPPPPVGAPVVVPAVPVAADVIVSTALTQRGVRYRNGGSDPSGFDCSGLVQWVFAQNGVRMPREVRDQFHAGMKIDLRDVRAGDLLFFETVSDGASHVGLAIGGDQFVHAPSTSGVVRVEKFTATYWKERFVGARRVATQATKTD